MFTNQLVDLTKSRSEALLIDYDLQILLKRLRADLAEDETSVVQSEAKAPEHQKILSKPWWQRISIPGTRLHTTSDRSRLQISDPGYMNTLGGELTPEEGFVLRPVPKWGYLKPIFPDVTGKSVLEIGCNNGFFCFEFSKLGAASVTGAEVFEPFLEPARAMKSMGGFENVNFMLTDALLDLTLPQYDVVFMSEVYGHFVDPFFGILRALNLSRQVLVIDNATLTSPGRAIDIGAGVDPETGKLTYHAWILSDELILSYLFLCGVQPERITRYIAPWQNHIVYVIDTSDVPNFRIQNDFQPCNTSFINMEWKK
jgi:2-polyprenyl-3-methyl-5-hydroxy-6-metoxy-1,4-benzoquinol methylase